MAVQFLLLTAIVTGGLAFSSQWTNHPWLEILAWFLVGAAILLGAAGALSLGRNLSPFPRPRPGSELVQTGVYAIVRHPLYTALCCGALGWSLLKSSLAALILSFGLGLFLDAKARREEALLRQAHPGYAHYAKRVRRLIPWVY